MAEPQSPKAPFSKARHQGGKTASLPNSTTHGGTGAPKGIQSGLNKGRNHAQGHEAGTSGKGRRGNQS